MRGDIDHVMPLSIDATSRIHFRGGSYIGISRANPTSDPDLLDNTISSLLRLNVSQLITIGGDDTAYSAMRLEARAGGSIRGVPRPKTIDHDLDVAPGDLEGLHEVERDAHGHLRIAEVNIGEILKSQVTWRLKALGIKATIAAKNIGYELRCADPIPFDMEYTRDLGYCAAKYLLGGGNAAVISLQAGRFIPIPFAAMIDPASGRPRTRRGDITPTRHAT